MFFHVIPSIQARRPNPGVFTAVVLYVPIATWAYLAAGGDGALDFPTLLLSVVIGACAMAAALVLLMIQPRFRYPDLDHVPSGS